MGSYASISIDHHEVISMKSYINYNMVSFFDESDRLVEKKTLNSESDNIWRIKTELKENQSIEELEEETEERIAYSYTLPCRKAIDRLELQGFSINRARQFFNESVKSSLEKFRSGEFDDLHWNVEEELLEEFLSNYSFDKWMSEVGSFHKSDLGRYDECDEISGLSLYQKSIMDGNEEDTLWGFPLACDMRIILRALLEAIPNIGDITLDYTDLVEGGYYSGGDKILESFKNGEAAEFAANSKIVVLAEGSSDIEFLRKSLELIYPHIYPMFSFFDFGKPNAGGGASRLVDLVMSFSAAGIVNRTIAVFDNDTAAKVAQKRLKPVTLPSHFKVMHYPEIQTGLEYPTIGADGKKNMNINGLAGSIELYFDEDILRASNGEFIPIIWKGLDESLNAHQGEFVSKTEIQKRFRAKLKRIKSEGGKSSYDLTGMKLIWNTILASISEHPFDSSCR